MTKTQIFAIIAAAAALAPVRASAQVVTTFSLYGASQKVCQLNGQDDWASGSPTAAQTLTNFGMYAADLGAPVDTGGSTLYFLFGDTWSSLPPTPTGVKPPNDSVGTSTLTATPTRSTCLGLQISTVASATTPTFNPPTVTPTIDQGSFNVPSGGVYADPSLFVFFWTDHCDNKNTLAASPSDPLALPAAMTGCAETTSLNSIGISVLGQSSGTSDVLFDTPKVGSTFVTMPSGFVYVNAVDATHSPNLAPSSQQLGVFITGVPRYRASVRIWPIRPRQISWTRRNGSSSTACREARSIGSPSPNGRAITTRRNTGYPLRARPRFTAPRRPRSASGNTR
jgi:hypothetical protein